MSDSQKELKLYSLYTRGPEESGFNQLGKSPSV